MTGTLRVPSSPLPVWLAGLALTVFVAGLGVFETTRTSRLNGSSSGAFFGGLHVLNAFVLTGSRSRSCSTTAGALADPRSGHVRAVTSTGRSESAPREPS